MKKLIKIYKKFLNKKSWDELIDMLEFQLQEQGIALEWAEVISAPEGEYLATEQRDTATQEEWQYPYEKEEITKVIARNRAMRWGVNPDKFTWWWYNA